MAKHNDIGKQGEELAVRFLKHRGYEILECNWRFKRAEIDIIGKQDDIMIFVEVKTRSSTHYGQPEEFLTEEQEHRIMDAASVYMIESKYNWAFRFDIISIVLEGTKFRLKHYKDAFGF